VTSMIRRALVVCLLLPLPISAQEPPREASTRYGLTLGVGLHQARDEVLNPVRHQGLSLLAGLFRVGESATTLHRVRVSFAFTPMTDRYSPDRSSMVFNPSLDFRLARRVGRLGDRTALYLGGSTGWETRFAFYENWDVGHGYWLTSAHLGFAGILARDLTGGGSLRLELELPLLAAVSRPPERFEYKEANGELGWVLSQIHQDMRITSVHQHLSPTLTLAYHRSGGGFLARRLFWETEFVSTRLPGSMPFTSLRHTLGISNPF
jgi:hypothetical protein